jgi:transposase InsO family protein
MIVRRFFTRSFSNKIAHLIYLNENMSNSAKEKVNILSFWDKHGLAATLDAFKVKKRTLYYWKKKFQEGGELMLNDQSKVPKNKRRRQWDQSILEEIVYYRQQYPNIGKDKLLPFVEHFCQLHSLKCPSVSTIGRLIADHPQRMRQRPQKLNRLGKIISVKRQRVQRKPKDFKATYPGECVALDTIEKRIDGKKRYIITFIDLYSRFAFAMMMNNHSSKEAKVFLDKVSLLFPFSIKAVLTDNGSEFKGNFDRGVENHWHTYVKTPKMNAHCERFNRTLQEEYIDYHQYDLLESEKFNAKLADYLFWYNAKRPHYALKQKSPIDFLSQNRDNYYQKCNMYWTYTVILLCKVLML